MKANSVGIAGTKTTRTVGLFPALIFAAAVGLFCSRSEAQIVTLSDQNSSAQVNLSSQAGMFNWTVDGQNELNQQWFWLAVNGVNNGAPTAINNLSAPSFSTPNNRLLETTYGNANYSVEVDYLLTGSTPGSGNSDIGESITLHNTSATAQTFHFYQYSDFNLGGGAHDVVQLGRNLRGNFDLADQQNNSGIASTILSETVATPGANHGEVALQGVTLAKLNNGLAPVTLADNSTAGPGNVTWAFQWDVTLNPGAEFLISKDKSIQIQPIPEPGSLSLISLGLFALVARKFRSSK